MAKFRKRVVFLSLLVSLAVLIWIVLRNAGQPEQVRYTLIRGNGSLTVDETNFHLREKLHKPGVILQTKGGLGNQLFQYACLYALAREGKRNLYHFIPGRKSRFGSTSPDDYKPFVSSIRTFLFRKNQGEFLLDKFQLPLTDFFIDEITVNRSSVMSLVSDAQLLSRNKSDFIGQAPFLKLDGNSYCQSPVYWADYEEELLPMFRVRPEVVQKFPPYVSSLEREIEEAGESVAVHVRRGDFTTSPGYFIPISYQRTAIRRLIKILQDRQTSPPKFFVFSDDPNYARRSLQDLASEGHDVIFVSYFPDVVHNRTRRTTNIQDFFLMTRCKHFIIPNSSFGWWAAYLATNWKGSSKFRNGSEQIVIASTFNPEFWNQWGIKAERGFYRGLYSRLYHPKEWIVINAFKGEH